MSRSSRHEEWRRDLRWAEIRANDALWGLGLGGVDDQNAADAGRDGFGRVACHRCAGDGCVACDWGGEVAAP